MMPMTRQEIEVLLDSPDRHDYVVSVYADLTVRNGFDRQAELHLKNQAKAATDALAGTEPLQKLDENLDVIRQAVQAAVGSKARGLAVFSSVARGFRQVVPLDFPVENRLVIDSDPFVLPILEHWYGDAMYLIALVDSDEAHLFEARHGHPDRVLDIVREDAHQEIQRDKPRFTYKKRFAQTRHERLHGTEEDKFLKTVAETIFEHFHAHSFAGLILLGQSQITGPLRRLLPNHLSASVIAEAHHAMTTEADGLAADVAPLIERAGVIREDELLGQLRQRCKENHLVAVGATDVLDALQQGRAVEVLLGNRSDIAGSRCDECNYRLGAPVRTCPYCGGTTRPVNAVQDILRMAMRQRLPVHVVRRATTKDDPLASLNGVAAFVRAEANWAPNHDAALASEGHSPSNGVG